VILQTWGTALLLVAGSWLVGNAVSLIGGRCRAAAPAVGLSLLMIVAYVTIRLPGRGVTAAVALLVVLLASGLITALHGSFGATIERVTAACIAGVGAAVPFIANGRVGLLGVSLDNDTAAHLIWSEGLRSPTVARRYGLNDAYPLGPHSLIDAVGTGLHLRLDLSMTALLIAIVMITALVAAQAFASQALWKQVVAGVFGSLLYLVAAYYAEGAFKEPIMGLLLLAMVLHLEELRPVWVMRSHARWLLLVPLSLLFAAGIYVYSYPALAWFGLTAAIWVAAEVFAKPRQLARSAARVAETLPAVALAGVIFLIVIAPTATRILHFAGGVGLSPAGTGVISSTNLGNLASALSPYEALGIWNRPDFRFPPNNLFHAGEFGGFALGVLIFGLIWSISRGELLLPAAVAACGIVYWRASHGQSPYLSAKALVIAGPVIAVTGFRGLLSTPATRWPRWLSLSRLAVALAFIGFAGHSSLEVLRDEPVWPSDSTQELRTIDRLTAGQTVVFLGHSDYAAWLFKDSDMSAIAADSVSMNQAGARPNKPYVYGTAFDFDTVDPTTINRFRWIVTTNTPYASQAPTGVVLVRRFKMYELWKRIAPVQPRQVIEPPGQPGAILNCHTTAGRALSRRKGTAAIMATPVLVPVGGIPPGGEHTVVMNLSPGRWNLSLQYTSAMNLELLAAGQRFEVPAYLDRPGPIFSVGTVSAIGKPLVVTIVANNPGSIAGPDLQASIPQLIATRSPDARSLVPLRAACGRYIDWYRLR
jgi:hypothetical protein